MNHNVILSISLQATFCFHLKHSFAASASNVSSLYDYGLHKHSHGCASQGHIALFALPSSMCQIYL